MIFIVEGIDRVGKTTLVERIKKEINFKVYKNNTSFRFDDMDCDNETDKMLKMLQIYELGKPNIIFDRFHWTDFVYGCIERNYSLSKAFINKDKIESMLTNLKARIILVKPTDLKESSLQHGKDLYRYQKLFEFLFEESRLDKMTCNYDSISEVVKWCKDEMNLYINGRW